ncbi:MAG: leucyl/phenylalanyl-tRNA--protein transferase [Ginsengibacter sp.]|jgi:leucyl/phenylalanyl-tRNA--protein transferase
MNFVYLRQHNCNFPPPNTARRDGILAVGGDLRLNTLLKAYKHGTFPWFNEGEPILWYHPDPRFVLFPDNLIISHSMRNVINKNQFHFTYNTNFAQTIRNCRIAKRKGITGENTWITDEIETAYSNLFDHGYAHSAETWCQGKLVGGLYGVMIGKVFFGESMFTEVNNASKFAFIKMVEFLQKNGVEVIDCQIFSNHLKSLGADFISREDFCALLKKFIP